MRDMACRGRYFNDLLLNVMLFVAVKYAAESSNDSCVSAMTFRRTAEEMLYRADTHLLTKSSVTTIQALLLMATTLFEKDVGFIQEQNGIPTGAFTKHRDETCLDLPRVRTQVSSRHYE